ncbi:universal stress protein [Streptomyces sp. NPDC018693]|uniref:universal stress protein n=1 Tax=unclassified Streptomyces TaxID=2593676 RepID=UPI0037B82265
MQLPLVVGVDGSEPSLRAVDWAADEAALRGARLRVVYASLWERYEGKAVARDFNRPADELRADDILDTAARRARTRQPDLKVTAEALPEEPEYALVHEGRQAALLVMGTRGRSGIVNLLLGSVSLTVAAHAPCPVVVLRGSHDNQTAAPVHGRVVVGVGEDPDDGTVLRFAYEEARRRGAILEAVRVWRCPAHETSDHPRLAGESALLHEKRAAEALDAALKDAPPDIELHRRTVEGHARRVLVDVSHRADLLIVGAQRREGHLGLQLGRVAHAALHHSACPVAVVPHPA